MMGNELKKVRLKMVFDQTNFNKEDLRDLFCDSVTKIFGEGMDFLDFLENDKYSRDKYDCFLDYNGENYIINRETGEYINWYKLSHIGRCINISTSSAYKDIPKWIEEFLIEFKESEEKEKFIMIWQQRQSWI